MGTANLTIDLDAITANWRALDRQSDPLVATGAVVKADAYGMGLSAVARALARSGARSFFVAIAEEGAALRDILGTGPEIYVFSGHMPGDTDMIGDLGLIPLLNSVEQLTRQFEALPGAPFGIQLDTGMSRLGLSPVEWGAVVDIALGQGPKLIMSHLASADDPHSPQNSAQLALFRDLTDGTGVPRSLAATGGILLGADYHFDMTRPGVGLYGGYPFTEANPALRLSLPVIQSREIESGACVGYNATWTATTPSRIATVSSGYADGLLRAMGPRLNLFAEDIPCPVVGRISMDLITVDITHLAETPRELDILCPYQGVDDIASAADTIGYEILTSLGARYSRRYIGGSG